MSLIKCPECNKEISDSIKTCIHCGYKLNDKEAKKSNNKLTIAIALLLIFVGAFIYFNISDDEPDSLVSCTDGTYYIQKLKSEYRQLKYESDCATYPFSGTISVRCGTIQKTYNCQQ
ncbi:MAG: zinc ribbon domain-containing protein [Bacilli bacterium]|nr:zinc ribbon domain-containing protein [Bacilli bacterium]